MFPLGLGLERVSSRAWSRWHRIGAAVAVVLSLAATFATIALIDLRTHEIAHADDVEVAASGRAFVRTFAVGTTVQQLAPLVGTATSGRCLVSTPATPVHIVNPNGVTPGEGPYCLDCAGGPSFSFPSASVYVVTTSGTATVGCSFFDGPQAASTSGGAGGLSSTAGDARYLKLDADNDPLLSSLSVDQATNTLASPTYTTATGRDLVIAPSLGVTGRGLFFSTSLASSATDAVMLTGSAAAGVGRTSLAFVSSVISAADRYVARFAGSGGDVMRIAGNGDTQQTGSVLTLNDRTKDIGSTTNRWRAIHVAGEASTGLGGIINTATTDPLYISSRSVVLRDSDVLDSDPQWSFATFTSSPTTLGLTGRGPKVVTLGNAGGFFAVPSVVTTAPVATNCTATNEGGIMYVDDTDDAAVASTCVCMATDTARSTFAWRMINAPATACVGL